MTKKEIKLDNNDVINTKPTHEELPDNIIELDERFLSVISGGTGSKSGKIIIRD